jgi:hypothetical protein
MITAPPSLLFRGSAAAFEILLCFEITAEDH